MDNDTEEKSGSYKLMEKAAVKLLINYKKKNTKIRNDGRGRIMDYGDLLDMSECAVRDYRVTHTKLFHFTKAGRERYRISCRLQELILSLRKDIRNIDQVKREIGNIFENNEIVEKGAKEVGGIIRMFAGDPLKEGKDTEKEKEKEKEKDIFEQQLDGVTVKHRYGDIRDTIDSFKKKYKDFEEKKEYIEKIPGIKDKEKEIAAYVQRQVIEHFSKAMFERGGSLKGMWPALQKGYERQKSIKLEDLKKDTLEKLIKEKKVPLGYTFTEEDIKSHKYWSEEDEELTNEEMVKAASDTAKDYFEGILNGIFGKEKTKALLDTAAGIQNFTEAFRDKMIYVSAMIGTVKSYGNMILDIAKRAENKKKLSEGFERADNLEVKQEDKKTLNDAGKFQTEEQKELTKFTAEHHRDMEKMAGKTADTIQNIEISRDVLNIAIQTGQLIAQGYGVSSTLTKPIVSAVRMGVDFALYIARTLKDHSMLEDYYKNTAQGRAEYESIVRGTNDTFGKDRTDEINSDMKKGNILNIMRIGKGYENLDELVTDTGMKMATSVAFSASGFNPVMENKIMTSTVMVVLGLRDKIGKTDNNTINSIFNAMKAA